MVLTQQRHLLSTDVVVGAVDLLVDRRRCRAQCRAPARTLAAGGSV
jgi:hypothetical protein